MQALNHNKASVAQDFHKAGGQFGNLYTKFQQQSQHHFDRDNDEENQQESYYNNNNVHNHNQMKHTMYMEKEKATSCSPPALPLSNNQSKRRRTTSLTHNDKENFSNPSKSISNVFDKLYQKSIANFMQQLVHEPESHEGETSDPSSNTRLMEFLENNPDLTISRVKGGLNKHEIHPEASPDSKRHNRKQSQPRKIDKIEKPGFSIEALRDKHLYQLVSDNGLKCRECASDKKATLNVNYQSKGALLFHQMWRHSEKKVRCKKCRKRFGKKYQLKLHVMFKHKLEEEKEQVKGRGRGRTKGKKGKTVKNAKATKGGKKGRKRRRRRRY